MRTRMYGGVRGRKTKVGGKSTSVFLLLDLSDIYIKYLKSQMIVSKNRGEAHTGRRS